MTRRERLAQALNHKEPDRVPVDFGSTAVTGMHHTIVAALRERYGLGNRPVKVHEPYQMLGLIEDDLQRALDLDVEGVFGVETMFGFRNEDWTPFRLDDGTEILVSRHFQAAKDKNGDTLVFPKGDRTAPPSGRMPKDGFFFDAIIRQPPIDEAGLDPNENCEEFGPISERDLAYFEAETRTGRGHRPGSHGDLRRNRSRRHRPDPGPLSQESQRHPGRRGVVCFDRDPAGICSSRLRAASRDRPGESGKNRRPRPGTAFKPSSSAGRTSERRTSQFCSAAAFRKLYLPSYRRINDWIHAHTPWKTFKHSCGAVRPLIPAFIEAGFDILNPVQVSAAGMDAEKLKADFGRDLVFWGGGIDTQKTLMFGSPGQVRDEVRRRLEIFGKDGGFVFNAVHNIQANVPPDNVFALFEALHER